MAKFDYWLAQRLVDHAAGPKRDFPRRLPAGDYDRDGLDPELVEFLEGTLDPEPATRWSLVQCLKSAYLCRARKLQAGLKEPLLREAICSAYDARVQAHWVADGSDPALKPALFAEA